MSHNSGETLRFGFWTYLMTDCVLFASFFVTYAVLRNNTFGGPGGSEIFDLPYILVETMLLLVSSFTCGLAMLAAHRQDKTQTLGWFAITLVLGLSFLSMEVSEFSHLISEGNGPQHSAFLSSYFSLVGLHGLHIAAGSIAMLVGMLQVARRGFSEAVTDRLNCLSLFWHFLDIIWIFIFTVVYLLGAM